MLTRQRLPEPHREVEQSLCSSKVQATDSKRSVTARRARPWLRRRSAA